MSTVITVENLGKKYLLKHQSSRQPYVALRDVMSDGMKKLGRRLLLRGTAPVPDPGQEEFWALKDVSFEVKQGDRVGIIGRNGAGKSTLLKILSRITEPTTGSVRIKGRVASLLEVGTGFHPELTGRENIFLNGAILGMGRTEIKKKFDEIVAFAEVERFLDTPVKRFSSGMYVRLAFAVAAHLEPEILVVDEVLAVGDAQFQKKCLGKMEDVSAKEGRTVLFVSHNMTAVRQLCQKGIFLQFGCVADQGPCQRVIENYLGQIRDNTMKETDIKKALSVLPEDPVIRLTDVIINQPGDESDMWVTGKPIHISIRYQIKKSAANLRIFFDILDDSEVLMFRSFHDCDSDNAEMIEPGFYCSEATVPADFLAPLKYFIRIGATIFGSHSCTGNHVLFPFRLYQSGRVNRAYTYEVYLGKFAPLIEWETDAC